MRPWVSGRRERGSEVEGEGRRRWGGKRKKAKALEQLVEEMESSQNWAMFKSWDDKIDDSIWARLLHLKLYNTQSFYELARTAPIPLHSQSLGAVVHTYIIHLLRRLRQEGYKSKAGLNNRFVRICLKINRAGDVVQHSLGFNHRHQNKQT